MLIMMMVVMLRCRMAVVGVVLLARLAYLVRECISIAVVLQLFGARIRSVIASVWVCLSCGYFIFLIFLLAPAGHPPREATTAPPLDRSAPWCRSTRANGSLAESTDVPLRAHCCEHE